VVPIDFNSPHWPQQPPSASAAPNSLACSHAEMMALYGYSAMGSSFGSRHAVFLPPLSYVSQLLSFSCIHRQLSFVFLSILLSTWKRISEQEVKRALFSQLDKNLPGLDIISIRATSMLWKWNTGRVVRLAMVVVRTGRHPAVWKCTSGVVVRQPAQHDYMKLKSYCGISLFSCMGKVDKKVVAELFSEVDNRRELLSPRGLESR
jgi:hypothetical protein